MTCPRGLLSRGLNADNALRADVGAVARSRRQDQAIAGGEIDGKLATLRVALVGQDEADRALYAVQHFFIMMAMDSIDKAGAIRPAIGRESLLLDATPESLLVRRFLLLPSYYLHDLLLYQRKA